MIIGHGKHVAVHYKLTGYEMNDDNQPAEIEELEQTSEGAPFEFIYGVGQLIAGFEKNIEGKQDGDTFDFTLSPSEAYGEWDENLLISLPKKALCDPNTGQFPSKMFTVGAQVPLQDQDGNIHPSTIHEITRDTVICDANHPLAGMTLHFVGHIQEVREATEQDKIEYMRQMTGHVEGHCGGGCHGGGCHGGGCNGNCGDSNDCHGCGGCH